MPCGRSGRANRQRGQRSKFTWRLIELSRLLATWRGLGALVCVCVCAGQVRTSLCICLRAPSRRQTGKTERLTLARSLGLRKVECTSEQWRRTICVRTCASPSSWTACKCAKPTGPQTNARTCSIVLHTSFYCCRHAALCISLPLLASQLPNGKAGNLPTGHLLGTVVSLRAQVTLCVARVLWPTVDAAMIIERLASSSWRFYNQIGCLFIRRKLACLLNSSQAPLAVRLRSSPNLVPVPHSGQPAEKFHPLEQSFFGCKNRYLINLLLLLLLECPPSSLVCLLHSDAFARDRKSVV